MKNVLTIAGLSLSLSSGSLSPFSTTNPSDIGFPTFERSGVVPSKRFANHLKAPFPTNKWFENLVFDPGTQAGNNVAPLPYIVQPRSQPSGIRVFYPSVNVSRSASTISLVKDHGVSLGSTENVPGGPYIDSYDQLSALTKFKLSDSQYMQAPIVRGMAYASMQYFGLTPRVDISNEVPHSIKVDGNSVNMPCNKLSGSNFRFKLKQNDETWKLYSNSPITFSCDYSKADHLGLLASAPSSATLRFALVNNCTYGNAENSHCRVFSRANEAALAGLGNGGIEPTNSTAFEALLDAHWQTMPVSASWDTQVAGSTGSVLFDFSTVDLTAGEKTRGNASAPASAPPLLLHTALPHHLQLFDQATMSGVVDAGIVWGHRNLRGLNRLVVGNSWTIKYPLTNITWRAPHPIAPEYMTDLKSALQNDKDYLPDRRFQLAVGDTYFSGKEYARLARIALIADEMGETAIRDSVVNRTIKYINPWLMHYSPYQTRMLYDNAWGGMISCGCVIDNTNDPHCTNTGVPSMANCPTLTDWNQDFGNGFYNDHHFHYGYYLYAMAVLGKFDPAWLDSVKEQALMFARDVANPSTSDVFFPVTRHKDWYLGSSWAGGVGESPEGRNQESTSESINAYYGLYLFGLSLGNQEMADLGRVMLAMEIKAAKMYWQAPQDSQIFPKAYRNVHHTVGIVWADQDQYVTFFGSEDYKIHGIQLLPVTPITNDQFTASFASQDFAEPNNACMSSKYYAKCQEGWEAILTCFQGFFDPTNAMKRARALSDINFNNTSSGGNGNSRLNVYYFIATQPYAHLKAPGKMKLLNSSFTH